jgi:hypothetical protein
MGTALDAIRAAVLQLLRDGEVHPQLVALAMARVAGALGADIAHAGGVEVETVLGDSAGHRQLDGAGRGEPT